MRSRISTLLCAMLCLPLVVVPANAATVVAGHSCSKAGATATSLGKSYVCVKVNGKLLWHLAPKHTTKPSPTPKPSPSAKSPSKSATPTPKASPSTKPTPTPSPTPKPTSSTKPTPTPSPSESQTPTAAGSIAFGQSGQVGEYKVVVTDINRDASALVCAANGNNDGCTFDDQKNAIVDPTVTTKWVEVGVTLTDTSNQAADPSTDLDTNLELAVGNDVPSTDFIPGLHPMVMDLQLNAGDTGSAKLFFEIDKSADTGQNLELSLAPSGGDPILFDTK